MSTAQVIAHTVAVKHVIDAAKANKKWSCTCAACQVLFSDPILWEAVLREAKSKGYEVQGTRRRVD